MAESLKTMKCVPCEGGEPPATLDEIDEYKKQVPGWTLATSGGIRKLQHEFKFKNFKQALDFTNKVGEIAEEEGHHPTLVTEWGKVTVRWWTHAIGGLHRNDFIMAARTSDLYDNGQ